MFKMEWLVVSSLAFFIGAMVWIAYDMAFRQNAGRKKH
jgi:hypothetical protein